MNELMSAIEGISDKHIKEFAFVQKPKRKFSIWIKFGSMVAGFVMIGLSIVLIANKKGWLSPVIEPKSEPDYTSSGNSSPQVNSTENGSEYTSSEQLPLQTESSENGSSDNSSTNSSQPSNVLPSVFFNDVFYVIADGYPTYDLPEGHVFVGEIIGSDINGRKENGYSSGCSIGDKIYQDPSNPHDLIVNTRLFSDNGYWYVRFVEAK